MLVQTQLSISFALSLWLLLNLGIENYLFCFHSKFSLLPVMVADCNNLLKLQNKPYQSVLIKLTSLFVNEAVYWNRDILNALSLSSSSYFFLLGSFISWWNGKIMEIGEWVMKDTFLKVVKHINDEQMKTLYKKMKFTFEWFWTKNKSKGSTLSFSTFFKIRLGIIDYT